MSEKCEHPEDDVLTTAQDKPWEGTCQRCGKRVRLVFVAGGEDD